MASTLQEFLRQEDILHSIVPPYAHELNSVPERFNQIVTQMARSMIDSNTLLFLWAKAIGTACFLANVTPHSLDKLHRTPYERLYDLKPAIKHLRPFGINAYVHILKEARAPGSKSLHAT